MHSKRKSVRTSSEVVFPLNSCNFLLFSNPSQAMKDRQGALAVDPLDNQCPALP
jgi:hypothetical protein